MILPELEQNTVYNAFNFSLHMDYSDAQGAYAAYARATANYTIMSVFLCPSDGNNGGGIVPFGINGTYSADTTIAPNPNGGPSGVPVTNYMMSFGDNYAILGYTPVCPNPWETAPPFPDGNTQARATMVSGGRRT